MNKTTIDYLFEDPPVTGQNYALVSIVGPNMPQKCSVWGLKIRGVYNTIDQAKIQTQKLMNVDNNYDIYTVEVGKFFPLQVEPTELQDVEYQNKQLNNLIKGYLENRETANQQWHARKNEMMQEAIREGQEQTSSTKEHPIAVLQSVQNLKDKIKQLKEELEKSENKLTNKMTEFNTYSEEERKLAVVELNKAFENVSDKNEIVELNDSLDNQYKFFVSADYLTVLLEEIKDLDHRLDILKNDKESNKTEIEKMENELNLKKIQLNDKTSSTSINTFINSNYVNSPYNNM
jgi:chromosome segregation ATPase